MDIDCCYSIDSFKNIVKLVALVNLFLELMFVVLSIKKINVAVNVIKLKINDYDIGEYIWYILCLCSAVFLPVFIQKKSSLLIIYSLAICITCIRLFLFLYALFSEFSDVEHYKTLINLTRIGNIVLFALLFVL